MDGRWSTNWLKAGPVSKKVRPDSVLRKLERQKKRGTKEKTGGKKKKKTCMIGQGPS